jgi:APA family basic amino acid/polyamine antiporter
MVGATTIMIVLLAYRAQTTWPGLVIVLTGLPIYFLWKFFAEKSSPARQRTSSAER